MAIRTGSRATPSARTAETRPGITGIVLAGGRSSRMGRDKAMLAWHGRTLLEHAIDLLVRAGCDRVLASGQRPGFPHVTDLVPGYGPLGGLHSVLSKRADLAGSCLVVVPLDMPLLRPAFLRAMWSTTLTFELAGLACDGHALPMTVQNDPELRRAVSKRLERGRGASLRGLQKDLALPRFPLPADAATMLSNMNTPAEWSRFADASIPAGGMA